MPRFRLPSHFFPVLGLVIAFGGAGYSATGGNFILGQTNNATSQTRLVAPFAGATLRVDNSSNADGASGMKIVTDSTRPPLDVSSSVKVANLNADRLDGFSSNQLLRVARHGNEQF
jgi:hypothetical protein